MKRLLLLAVAIAAVTFVTETNANAQGYQNGYEFGTGLIASDYGRRQFRPNLRGFDAFRNFDRIRTRVRPETQPYFAVNPPVYYSHIVKRPYGVSPFPAPSGIMPVEMQFQPAVPVTIKNPFFNQEVAPAKVPAQPKAESGEKTTWIANPYMTNMVKR